MDVPTGITPAGSAKPAMVGEPAAGRRTWLWALAVLLARGAAVALAQADLVALTRLARPGLAGRDA